MSQTTGETHGGYAVAHQPTPAERIWRALGFRYHLGEDPPETDGMPGWMCTETNMHFGWLDRLRLLLTGRLHIRLTQHLRLRQEPA